jgi:hypothetical protein
MYRLVSLKNTINIIGRTNRYYWIPTINTNNEKLKSLYLNKSLSPKLLDLLNEQHNNIRLCNSMLEKQKNEFINIERELLNVNNKLNIVYMKISQLPAQSQLQLRLPNKDSINLYKNDNRE